MAVQFPQSPQEGDQFISGGVVFTFEDNKWVGATTNSTLNSLVGATGPKGDQGDSITGATGDPGPTGPAGPDGGNASTLKGFDDYYRSGELDLSTRGDIKMGNKILKFGLTNDAAVRWGGTSMYMDITSKILFRDLSLNTRATIFTNNGNMTLTGTLTENSDISLKKDIVVIDGALSKVYALRGVTYDRTDIETTRQTGVIAQEVEAVLPEAVIEDENGIKSVAYGNLVGLLVEAIKELKDEVADLRSSL